MTTKFYKLLLYINFFKIIPLIQDSFNICFCKLFSVSAVYYNYYFKCDVTITFWIFPNSNLENWGEKFVRRLWFVLSFQAKKTDCCPKSKPIAQSLWAEIFMQSFGSSPKFFKNNNTLKTKMSNLNQDL